MNFYLPVISLLKFLFSILKHFLLIFLVLFSFLFERKYYCENRSLGEKDKKKSVLVSNLQRFDSQNITVLFWLFIENLLKIFIKNKFIKIYPYIDKSKIHRSYQCPGTKKLRELFPLVSTTDLPLIYPVTFTLQTRILAIIPINVHPEASRRKQSYI